MSQNVGTHEELPLTPAVADWLRSEIAASFGAANPLRFTLMVFGCAVILAGVLSAIFLPQGASARPGVLFLWVLCLAIAGMIVYSALGAVVQKRRDLSGGTFIRWTGPFSTRRSGGARSLPGVIFGVDGRDLWPEPSAPLYSIESGSGVVDYLPNSAKLLEVRDDAGNVLWTRVSNPNSG